MSAAGQKTLSILLVEDSPADGRLLMEALRPAVAAGEVVLQTVKRLGHALDALQGYEFSCVLLDLGLPDGQGVGNVRALREVDRKTAIIVLTGLADEKLAAEALTLGAQDYLVKGECDGEQLLKQLRRAEQRNRQTFALETRRDLAFFEASHDALTLLPNSALFADRARQQLAVARAAEQGFGLAHLRVLGLADARKRYGALLGDELLKTLSQRLSEGLLSGQTLGRLGEEEFGLLRHGSSTAAEWAAQLDICAQRVASLTQLGDCAVSLRLSTGLAEFVDADSSVEDLLALAQQSAALAKVPAGSAARPPLEAGGQTAIWQAWMDISSGTYAGFECSVEAQADALTDSRQAAQTVLACAAALSAQAQQWLREALPKTMLAIKVPALALSEEGFDQQLADCLNSSGWPTTGFQLEVGEAAFRQLPRHQVALTRLRGQGFRLVMDGDGTQDISLYDFSAFAVDGYKLSAAVTRRLMDESLQGRTRRFVSAVLGAAQQLGAIVIATGVDSEDCVTTLRLIGVRWMQGKALGPALDPTGVVEALAS